MISVLLSRPQHLAQLRCQGQDTFRQSQAVALFCSRLFPREKCTVTEGQNHKAEPPCLQQEGMVF